jgi:hypothetical protein
MPTDPKMAPDRILEMGFGFFASKTLMTAVQLNVFGRLQAGPMTRQQLTQDLGLSLRGERDFFDALVALKLLEKESVGPDFLYSNTRESEYFLVPDSPNFVGGILIMAGERLYKFWNDLPEALVTGKPQSEVKHLGRPLFDEIFQDPQKLRSFALAMAGLSRHNFERLVGLYPFERFATHLDIGASTGLLSRLVVEKFPQITSVAFDLPEVCTIARELLADCDQRDRISIVPGSFLTDALPSAHIMTLGNILHDWNRDQKLGILGRVFDALEPGGACLIIENIIDDARQNNAFGLLMSLNMLIEFGEASDSTFSELEELCGSVGFRRFERLHIHGPCSALVAHKD